jgi:hypothetical protein
MEYEAIKMAFAWSPACLTVSAHRIGDDPLRWSQGIPD